MVILWDSRHLPSTFYSLGMHVVLKEEMVSIECIFYFQEAHYLVPKLGRKVMLTQSTKQKVREVEELDSRT